MENVDRLNGYLGLLKIRQRAYRRNMILAGALFVLALLATTFTLLLMDWNPRSVFLMALFDVLFTVNFVMAWARLEINREHIELVNSLQG